MQPPQRPSPLRVLAVLRPGDQSLLAGLATNHCVVVGTALDTLDRTVGIERANAVVIDVDLQGAFEAVGRLRRVGGMAGSVPVAFLGAPELSTLVADFLQRSGPGFFAPRPVVPADLAQRLRNLHELGVQQHRATSTSGAVKSIRNSPPAGTPRLTHTAPTRTNSPQPFTPPVSPLRGPTNPPISAMRAPTPVPGALMPVPSAIGPVGAAASATTSIPPVESPLAQAASPALRSATVSAAVWTPPSLSGPLTSLLRNALSDVGGIPEDFELPIAGPDDLDDLVPPELLEPLDAPIEALAEESGDGRLGTGPSTSPGVTMRRNVASKAAGASGVTPLPVDGDLRLAGTLGRYGVAQLLAAAGRARATGVVFVQARQAQWQVCLHAGHVLAVRGSRPEDFIGPALVRLGYIPQEAARFAEVPLDAGVRGAALLASRGYLSPDGVAPVLARAAQEMLFDLLCLDNVEWEIRALESSVGIPMHARTPESLLILGARARIEPVAAYSALGGDGTSITLRAEASTLASLPLTPTERAAALAAHDVGLASLVRTHGEPVLPALLALHWLQVLRVEGPAHDDSHTAAPSPERTRLRALLEAARRKDLLAVLGVSAFATRSAAALALEARRAEVDAIRARNPTADALPVVTSTLDELARTLQDANAWERYVTAMRAPLSREE